MKKLQVICGILVMAVFVYCVADLSGLVDYFNDAVNERNGWVEVTPNGYARTKVVSHYYWDISIMNDPKFKTFSLYVANDTLKKEALDRMAHIEDLTVQFKTGESESQFGERLKFMAKYKGANTVIVNGTRMTQSIKTESFALPW